MSQTSVLLVRLCSRQEWALAQQDGWIRPEPTDAADGGEAFVHLSTVEQVHLPANRLYSGRRDMVLLYVDPAALDSPLRWEPGVPTDPESMLFPHLYGPLPVEAVTEVAEYPPAPDGGFPALLGAENAT